MAYAHYDNYGAPFPPKGGLDPEPRGPPPPQNYGYARDQDYGYGSSGYNEYSQNPYAASSSPAEDYRYQHPTPGKAGGGYANGYGGLGPAPGPAAQYEDLGNPYDDYGGNSHAGYGQAYNQPPPPQKTNGYPPPPNHQRPPPQDPYGRQMLPQHRPDPYAKQGNGPPGDFFNRDFEMRPANGGYEGIPYGHEDPSRTPVRRELSDPSSGPHGRPRPNHHYREEEMPNFEGHENPPQSAPPTSSKWGGPPPRDPQYGGFGNDQGPYKSPDRSYQDAYGAPNRGAPPHEMAGDYPPPDPYNDPHGRGPDSRINGPYGGRGPPPGAAPPGVQRPPPPGHPGMQRDMYGPSYASDPGPTGYPDQGPLGDPYGAPPEPRSRSRQRPEGRDPRGLPPGGDPRHGNRPPDPRRGPPRDPRDPRAPRDPRRPPPGQGKDPRRDAKSPHRPRVDRHGRPIPPGPPGSRGPPGLRPDGDNMPPRPSTAPGRHPNDKDRGMPRSPKSPNGPGPGGQKPPPIRPGLQQGGPNGVDPSSRPPPVRQYDTEAARMNASSASQKEKRKSEPITQAELSRIRGIAQSNPSNQEAQLNLAKSLAQAAKVLSDEGGKADPITKNRNRERYNSEAQKIARQLSDAGYPDGQFYLADSISSSAIGLTFDAKEAFMMYQNAAKANHAQAAYRTAVCCEIGAEEGGGTRRDISKAIQWYQRAGNLGDAPAMFKLGMINLRGLLEQPKNPNEAIDWLKKACDHADAENPHALHELAILYEGIETPGLVPRDETRALQLFTQGGKLGYKHSQCKLGQAWEYGSLGCPIEARNSIVWYTRAAAQGEHNSELALSGWYLTGSEGILEQSDVEAYLWAKKAADARLPKALFALGYFTEVGIGCQRSLEEAKKWYAKAAGAKFPKAQQRLDELMRGGERAQRQQRERLSRSNPKQHENDCVVM